MYRAPGIHPVHSLEGVFRCFFKFLIECFRDDGLFWGYVFLLRFLRFVFWKGWWWKGRCWTVVFSPLLSLEIISSGCACVCLTVCEVPKGVVLTSGWLHLRDVALRSGRFVSYVALTDDDKGYFAVCYESSSWPCRNDFGRGRGVSGTLGTFEK